MTESNGNAHWHVSLAHVYNLLIKKAFLPLMDCLDWFIDGVCLFMCEPKVLTRIKKKKMRKTQNRGIARRYCLFTTVWEGILGLWFIVRNGIRIKFAVFPSLPSFFRGDFAARSCCDLQNDWRSPWLLHSLWRHTRTSGARVPGGEAQIITCIFFLF